MKPATKQSATAALAGNDLESFRDIADDVIESDFVPFACLYGPETIATKNGELLQTIKLTGLGFDAGAGKDLRSAIRSAIQQTLPDASYAVWLHTLRRRQSLLPHSHFPDAFSGQLDAAWRAQHPSSASFINELYITIVTAGESASMRSAKSIFNGLIPGHEQRTRTAFLDAAQQSLGRVVDQLLDRLAPYGARRLGLVERDGVFYSQQLEFLEKLINLEERPMEVPRRDLSLVLTSGEFTFGYNAMEVRTAEGKRRFAAIFSIKEYKESTLKGIDQFLTIPCELIITQCFDFIGGEQAREAYEKQARYLKISGDKELAEWMEIDRLVQAGTAGERFGQQQTTLFLIAPSMKQLDSNIRLVGKALARLGIVAVREDLRFEECYWAQLPSNFPFISRKQATDSNHLAGFANLQTQPMGNAAGTSWGAPISLLTTVQDQPYFFNFHRDGNGHTLVVGPPKSGATTMVHFLVAQARKLNPTIWYLDGTGRGRAFMEAMGGQVLTPGSAALGFNPLQLDDTQPNRDFLAFWLSTLIDPEARQLNEATLAFFQSLVAHAMQLPRGERRLSNLLPGLREADAALAYRFQQWCAGGANGELFDRPQDQFTPGTLTLWDLSAVMDDPARRIPLVSYLLHRLTANLSGNPTLLVMSEGLRQLTTPLFAPRAGQWWDHLASKNTACLLTTSAPEADALAPFTPILAQKTASQFFMPYDEPSGEFAMGFGLNESDLGALVHMDAAHRHVLLKRGAESTMLKLNLASLGDGLRTLSGRAAPPPQKSPADLLNELMGFGAPA